MTAPDPRVAIIGLGLMGGSLARDLAARSVPVLGFDRRPEVAAEAVEHGVIERSIGPDLAEVREADLVVLATPVDVAVRTIPEVARLSRPGAIVTDVGSTKRDILAAAEGAGLAERFVGSHPLTGDQRSGWNVARSGLYAGASVFVCPGPGSSATARDAVLGLWRSVGAHPREIGASDHDRLMSAVSHLPQVASSALAIVLSEAGFGADDLGPGGRDMTRLADSSPEMWTAIAGSNADNLLASIGALEDVLKRVRTLLEKDDREGLREFFEAARRLRG